MKAEVPLSSGMLGVVSELGFEGLEGATDSTETICAMQGSTPATPCPVMMACVYSPTPKLVTYANTPF